MIVLVWNIEKIHTKIWVRKIIEIALGLNSVSENSVYRDQLASDDYALSILHTNNP